MDTRVQSLIAEIEALSEAERQVLAQEGQNIAIEYRFAEGGFDRLADLAAELVRLQVDIIVTGGTLRSRVRPQDHRRA